MLCCKKKPLDKKTEPLVEYPDGGWGWFVCLATFTTQFIVLGTMNNFGVMYVELLREFNVGKAEAAWVGSITYGMMFLLGPLGTTLCKKIGCRLTTIIGCSTASGACLLASIAPNIYVMDLTYGLMFGVGASLCYFPTVVILGTYFNKKLSLANGLTSSGSGVGSLAMGPVLQGLLSRFGMRNTMRISAAMLACIIVIALVYRPINTPFLNGSKYDKEKEANQKKKGCARFVDFSLFKNKAYLVWCGSLSFWMLGYFVPFVHLIRLATLQGIDMFKATLLIGMMSVGSTVGRLFFGKIADHPKINRLYLYQFSFLMIGISNTICPLMTNYGGLAFYATFFGFFEGCYVLLAPVLTGDIVGRNNMATGVGVLFAIKSVPLTIGPPLAGFIYDTSNSYEVAFYIAGAVPILAACIMFAIPFLMPKDQEDETDHKHYGKFEVIMDEKEEEDRSSGYDSQPRIPQLFIEPATPTLPPESLRSESLPQIPPHILHNPKRLSGDHTELRPISSIPKHLRPKSVQSFASLTGSHVSINSILSRSGPSTYNMNALPPIQENSDHYNVRRSRVLELQRELSPSVFSLVRRRLELGAPTNKKTMIPKQISASKYGGSIGCISITSDAVPLAYSEEVAKEEDREREIMIGKVSCV
ncbi:monocarboxylate transporter 10-like [Actinia tenebrosa]|uniref:Monocarboxylate transporter 10-like n=1 Tax=Actinia tenebrosa TaxID=6105 RepID=A0A6P8IN42_ACTTE|nr:monocarboxylate transporter 10-like [Actinia tenebrosa]